LQESKIVVTFFDRNRLRVLIDSEKSIGKTNDKILYLLENKLKKAEVVLPENVPEDIITMNSKFVYLDMGTGNSKEYTIVYPKDADIDIKRISILTPVGSSLFGHAVGDAIEVEVPAGRVKIRIEKLLFQPEAHGIYIS